MDQGTLLREHPCAAALPVAMCTPRPGTGSGIPVVPPAVTPEDEAWPVVSELAAEEKVKSVRV